jgi:hypothetical protein
MAGIEVSWTLKQWVDQIKTFPELAKQRGSSLSEHELAMLLGENAMRVYRLQPPRRKAETTQPLTATATT